MDKGEKLIKKPTYPGGRTAMGAFIREHMVYPEKALANKVDGVVALVVDIDGNGFVTGGKVKKGLGSGCDEEALRLCKLLKFSTSAKRKNRRITFHRSINIRFKLPKPKLEAVKKTPPPQQSQGLQIVYSYVPKKK